MLLYFFATFYFIHIFIQDCRKSKHLSSYAPDDEKRGRRKRVNWEKKNEEEKRKEENKKKQRNNRRKRESRTLECFVQ